MICIRPASENDIVTLEGVLKTCGGAKENDHFIRCFHEQRTGQRQIYIAFHEDRPAGYVHLVWAPVYAPFARAGIPEIQDLNVIPDLRQKGIGTALMELCEQECRNAGKTEIGLGVGLYGSYGPAQRLYVRRGYLPDGNGIVYKEETVKSGGVCPVNDDLMLKMVKAL